LTPIEVRDFLDSPAGRLLADDICFIEGGPKDTEAIEMLINARLRHVGWRRLYEQTLSEIRAQERTPINLGHIRANASRQRKRSAHGTDE
jgi:hypothetical protein